MSLVDHQTGIVLSQGHVEKTDLEPKEEPTDVEPKSKLTEEEKKERSELAVASRLIEHLDWKGRVLTGDALYCQRRLCSALRQAGGDYLFLVRVKPAATAGRSARARVLHSHQQNEPVRESCAYLSNTLKRQRRPTDVWTSEAFGCLLNSRATPIGLAREPRL